MALISGLAIGTGVALGLTGSGFVFNYTKNEYTQKISELQLSVDALQGHLNDMKELRDRVPSFWDDDNGNRVYRELEDTISKTESEMEDVKAFIRTLQTVVNELDGSQNLIKETIDDLSNLVLSVLGK